MGGLPRAMNNLTPIGRLDTHQSASYTGTAGTIANPVGGQTRKVRVVVTSAAFVKIGSNPTATTADVYMPANLPEYFIVSSGQSVSAIQVSSNGVLHVTEIV
jgi:hypothetical protein